MTLNAHGIGQPSPAKAGLISPIKDALAPFANLRPVFQPAGSPLVLRPGEQVLGILEHGLSALSPGAPADVPTASVAMKVLSGAGGREIWLTDLPVTLGESDGIFYASNDDWLFGVLQVPADEPDRAACAAYLRLLTFIRTQEAGRLVRLWNYFPGINREQGGLERYRRFCLGRHEAFASCGYPLDRDLPAASAVGSRQGELVIAFLAGRGDCRAIENPLQLSAYRYPSDYGPRSPSFSRAMRVTAAGQDGLFISGTASIRGHRTVGQGDPLTQCRTTLENLATLVATVTPAPLNRLGDAAHWKIYLRDRALLDDVRAELDRALDPATPRLYVAGDICRLDLLLEIEGYIDLGKLSALG
jgi:chorismate lyase/3-hydroxybenzoate synthase